MGPLIWFHPFRNVLPIVLNGLPKNLLAIDSLITATSGACRVSCSLKSRPAMNGVSMVAKNPGLIELVHTTISFRDFGIYPSTWTIWFEELPLTGVISAKLAERTPGMA